MPPVKVSLIISTYQSPDALEKVLQGMAGQTQRPHEILIADDGSGPPTRALLERWQPRLGLRHVWHEDVGFRKTIILNQTVAATTGNYVVLLEVPQDRVLKKLEERAAVITVYSTRRIR